MSSSSYISAVHSSRYLRFKELGLEGFFKLPEKEQYELLSGLPSPGLLLSQHAKDSLFTSSEWEERRQKARHEFVPTSRQLKAMGDYTSDTPLSKELKEYERVYCDVLSNLKNSENESLRNLAVFCEKNLDAKVKQI